MFEDIWRNWGSKFKQWFSKSGRSGILSQVDLVPNPHSAWENSLAEAPGRHEQYKGASKGFSHAVGVEK